MANLGTFETLLVEVGKALLPLKKAVSSPNEFFAFMLKLGWQADEIPQPLQNLGAGLDTLFSTLRKIVGDGLSVDGSVSLDSASGSTNFTLDDILRLKQAVEQIMNGIQGIATAPDAAIPASLRVDNFKTIFPEQLINFLIINYLTTYQSSVAFAFRALGIIKTTYTPAAGNRLAYVHYTIDFSDVPAVLENPRLILENAFGWGLDDFDYRAFVSQLDNLLSSIGVDVFLEEMQSSIAAKIEGDLEIPGNPVRKVMRAVFFERARPSGRMSADIRLLHLPKNGAQKPGIAVMPAFNGLLDFKMQLADDIAVIIKTNLDLQGGVALLIRPDTGIEMILGFNNPGAPTHATGSASIGVERSQVNNTPTLILGSPDATRLQFRKIGGTGGIRLEASNAVDMFTEFEVKGLEFVLQASEADGFIRHILPSDGVKLGFDLALGISYLRGFYFRGTSSLEIAIPAHIQLGVIELQSAAIGLIPQGGALPINLGATFKAELGPLKVVVDNIGLRCTFTFPNSGGNLGPANIELGFKPPKGVGLSIDAGPVKGGGYLDFDPDKGEYAGFLELDLAGIVAVKAIGLISTRMPDGSSGFSLLLIITAEFGTGIQLGFGFTLLGVGGLLGLNRTMRLEPIAQGIRTGGINSVMFPQNVIANAPRIISDLKTYFPVQEGIFLIGPMVKLGWGTPTLVSLSMGIIIEIPGNIAILGVLKVVMPDENAPLLVLQVGFIGALEFDKKRAWFYAAMFDSRVLFMTIDGGMGVLVAWGSDANFVVSVGGFHPQFNPPPLPFPTPNRISIDILNQPGALIRVSGYFAVTSNTVQFGAKAELRYGLDDLGIKGHLAFDALFQFSPFYFIIQISASMSVTVFGVGLFSVRISMSLNGPTPWRAKGSGSISLLFFDISVDFDITWGEQQDTTLPPIAVMPLLKNELSKVENWTAQIPPGSKLLVSLRELEAGADGLVLHPVGQLRVSQRALPLDFQLDKIGAQKPNDATLFSLSVEAASGFQKAANAKEAFAVGQFKEMPDAAKLSLPAYNEIESGVILSAEGKQTVSSHMAKRNIRYETVIIDTRYPRVVLMFFRYSLTLFAHFIKGSAIMKSPLSLKQKKLLQPFEEKIVAASPQFAVAFSEDNKPFKEAVFSSEIMAREYMQEQISAQPGLASSLHVIPQYEVSA